MLNPGIVRNRLKINSIIKNAKAYVKYEARAWPGRFCQAFLWELCRRISLSSIIPGKTMSPKSPQPQMSLKRCQNSSRKLGFSFRRANYLLRLYAGGWHGKRSSSKLPGLFPVSIIKVKRQQLSD